MLMPRFFFALLLVLGTFATTYAQEVAVDDVVTRTAAALESDLTKYKNTTPEAAEVMVKLVDLYHQHARLFGLVRTGQLFVTSHPQDPRHEAVMLKLIDGLEAMSRNKETAAATREFISRYPNSAKVADMEVRLGRALDQINDPFPAAEAWRAVYRRQRGTPVGIAAGIDAIARYDLCAPKEQFIVGADLALEMLDGVPANSYAERIAWRGIASYRRGSEWAKANVLFSKLLSKNLPTDPKSRREVHRLMAEHYGYLSQHANAAASLKQVRALGDDATTLHQLVMRMYYAGAKGAEMAPLVNEYQQKFADKEDKHVVQSYLAHAYLRDGDKPNGVALLAQLIKVDAGTNGNAQVYQQQIGGEPAQLAEAERVLREALNTNKRDPHILRYVLAFSIYRDGLKDVERAKAMAWELVSTAPSDDHYTTQTVDWLLYTLVDDPNFPGQVQRLIAARNKFIQLAVFRQSLAAWVKQARTNPEHKKKGDIVAAELAKADADPFLQLWLKQTEIYHPNSVNLRKDLLGAQYFGRLDEAQALTALRQQDDYYRHYAPGDQRPNTIATSQQWAQRFPTVYEPAYRFLEASTEYGGMNVEVAKLSCQHMLRQEPISSTPEVWRRLLWAADKTNDVELVKQAHAWIQKATQKYGKDAGYASYIGDILNKHKLTNEATAYWTTYLDHDPNHSESRECAIRLIGLAMGPQREQLLQRLFARNDEYQGRYALYLANDYFAAGKIDDWERVIRESRKRQDERPFANWDMDESTPEQWVGAARANEKFDTAMKQRVYKTVIDMRVWRTSAVAELALIDLLGTEKAVPMDRLLAIQRTTRLVGNDAHDWDRLYSSAQLFMTKKDYAAAGTLATAMLTNIPNLDPPRAQAGRDMVAQSYARIGGVGLTIDETSPAAPLMQAALYLRLGDERLAFDAYAANIPLFNEHRKDLPVDFVLFISERLIAAGGDENHDQVENTLRDWLVRNAEGDQFDIPTKARVQLTLAKNYFKAQRFDIARGEYTSVVNRYPNTPQAVEAEFGIGETFLSQKVFDQAEMVFDKLARSHELDIVVRAEFLRGVLTFRRGDKDEARDIFRSVLERVPNVELANQALYNLAEVYGAEERYIEQLNLLRTIGRLGRASKRRHVPGQPLSIVVHDSDLGISRGHNKIPVRVTTEPGGDSEIIYLTSAGAGKGLFRADLETRLGSAAANSRILELTGKDVIKCDYPEEFRAEFKSVPLSDVEITIADSAKFAVASSKIEEEKRESFSQQLEREASVTEEDERVSQARPANQIKPGNPVYLRVKDADQDTTNEADKLVIKLTADSGDQVQVTLTETGPHTGLFEGTASTGELPAGALATDTAIDHSPLMSIDRDEKSAWLSKPDGATPKMLTVDMKDLKSVARAKFWTPDSKQNAPVRADLVGSYDGQFWFKLAGHPAQPPAMPLTLEYGPLKRRIYRNFPNAQADWSQVAQFIKNSKAFTEEAVVEGLSYKLEPEHEDAKKSAVALWYGTFVQPRAGAVRFKINSVHSAILLDGNLELPLGQGDRSVDIWVEAGVHQLAILAGTPQSQQGVEALLARADLNNPQVVLSPFRASDFDVTKAPAAEVAKPVAQPIKLGVEEVSLSKKTEMFGQHPAPGNDKEKCLGYWQTPEDIATWRFSSLTPGAYEVWLNWSHQGAGSKFQLTLGNQTIEGPVTDTGTWEQFRQERVGVVLLENGGPHNMAIKPIEVTNGGLMALKGIELRPATGGSVILAGNTWEFRFPPRELRYTRLVVHEYLGEAVAINHVEVSGENTAEKYIPTEADVLTLAENDSLEIAGGDTVTATYADQITNNESGGSQLLEAKLTATYYNAFVEPISYDFSRNSGGDVVTTRKDLARVDPGERVIVEITDYDEDRTSERDTIKFSVAVNEGEPVELEATETQEYSGIFTKEVDTTAKTETGKLTVKPGDRIYIRYVDAQNTFPGHSVPRESIVFVNAPTDGKIRLLPSLAVPTSKDKNAPLRITYNDTAPPVDTVGVAFEAPLTVEVIDPDAAKDSKSKVTVNIVTTDGATIPVECVVSSAFKTNEQTLDRRWALSEGRFVGQVILQLGGKASADIVPLTANMPRQLIGGPKFDEKTAMTQQEAALVARVLNVTGKDLITATYTDELRATGKATELPAKGRLIAAGELMITDREYEKPVEQLHVGERLYLLVTDPDRDTTDARDTVAIEIIGERGEQETVELAETLAHSGVFTGSFLLKAEEKPTPGNVSAADPVLESYFGDRLRVKYADPTAPSENGKGEVALDIPVVVGTDGLVAAFTKTFHDDSLAVETKFRIAESYFELFKSHKSLARSDEQKTDLEAGRRVLREVMEDFPDPQYAPRVAYLLGQFAQELQQWDEAIRAYDTIIRQFPEHSLAADAQYKLAQAYEESGEFDQALEAYVTLAATYPKSPLIASVMIRISDYFYKHEDYLVAAQVGQKFLERFPEDTRAPRMAFRVGQSYFKQKKYEDAGKSFDKFIKLFPEDALAADSVFWSGESYRMGGQIREAFRRYNECHWKHPSSEAAKYARGRLALPEMLQQFEAEARAAEDQ